MDQLLARLQEHLDDVPTATGTPHPTPLFSSSTLGLPHDHAHHVLSPLVLAAENPLLVVLAVIGLLTTATLLIQYTRKNPAKLPYPPSPRGAWPLLGHLPLLAYHASAPDKLFASLASTLGPVYMLRLGAQRMLVVNSDKLARESLLRNGKAYAGRLLTAPWAVLSEGANNMGFAPYGEKWRAMRRAAHKILTPAAVDAMDMRLELEADRLVAHLTNVGTAQVESLFQRYTANVIFSKALGVTYDRLDDPELVALLASVTNMFRVLAVGGIDEYVPDSGWFWGSRVVRHMVLWTAREKMAVVNNIYDEFYQATLTDRLNDLKAQLASETAEERAARDLCYAEELLLMMADLVLAGTDTTAGTLMWIAILLVNHPDVQRKAYDSLVDYCGIDPGTGKVRVPTLADSTQLTYIRAIVKETLRMIPIGPLGLPRATIEDTHIAGYHVPKGTQVVYNIDAIHEGMYPESKGGNEFRPERWLDEGFADGRGKGGVEVPDGIFTFGLGRRQCPGMHLATRELCLVTARLVAAFELRSGEPGKKELSLERQFGLTSPPKHGAMVEFVVRQ
ncbi:cytochrome P450 [Catenaria anguillulae PL171]|uniref:Cytochrome P450 n=1 Tax=Catenaria anguillulae PL171 TaxID=765915 RepID=A0A1Y2HMY3_9FUNG|nr:cytochrome P450 [Catenaria anguillulae PL171]